MGLGLVPAYLYFVAYHFTLVEVDLAFGYLFDILLTQVFDMVNMGVLNGNDRIHYVSPFTFVLLSSYFFIKRCKLIVESMYSGSCIISLIYHVLPHALIRGNKKSTLFPCCVLILLLSF